MAHATVTDSVTFDPSLLRKKMSEKGITHSEMEKILGVSNGLVSKWMARERINYYQLDIIACTLGCHPMEFML
jgi:uncharacterized HAD superfamily protein